LNNCADLGFSAIGGMTTMKRDEGANRAFQFLLDHAKSGKSFTLSELIEASGWTPGNTKTNLTKRLKDLVSHKGSVYYVNPEIFRVRLEDFKDLFRQKHRLFTDYLLKISQNVLVYEFFMPLAREDRLREALDNLFFEDIVEQRISEIGVEKIRKALKLPKSSTNDDVRQFVLQFMDNTIGGYSLLLVNGRFRAGSLATRTDIVSRPFFQGPYIVDETTAIVRFILPVSTDQDSQAQLNLLEPAKNTVNADERAEQMRWLFLNFFAEAITRVVRKEDEIWLLESGVKSALYRWVRKAE
jgi:hypothetical protein